MEQRRRSMPNPYNKPSMARRPPFAGRCRVWSRVLPFALGLGAPALAAENLAGPSAVPASGPAAARAPGASVAAALAPPAAASPAPAFAAPTAQATPPPAPARPEPEAPADQPAPVAPTPAPPYKFQPGVICPLCEITPQYPLGRSGLHWHDHWRLVDTREYVTIAALAAGFVGLRLFVSPDRARWDKPILFDDAARDALRISSASGRRTAGTVSDVLFVWEVVHPTLIDPFLVAWWQRKSPLVAWQMVVIDAQAYALTILINDAVKRLTSRARPWVSTGDCAVDPSGSECGSGGRYQAFYSGHAAVTATGAGLLCAHHLQLSLYQNDLLDVGTCALAVVGTALTGALRVASDNHWASDVLVGHLSGYLSGYLLPTLLYYKEFRARPHEHEPTTPTFAALPLISGDSIGVSVLGAF